MENRVLVAGVGNVFFGDDGFGVEVVRRMAARPQPAGVRIVDFGIRGFDLASALVEPRELVILVDAVRRGGSPGTLYLLEAAEVEAGIAPLEGHALTPAAVLRAARQLGGVPGRTLVVGCEPLTFGEPEVGRMGLSAPVSAAVEGAITMILETLEREREGSRTHA